MRLLIWNDKYFLLAEPPARLTTKVISALISEGWIRAPQIISNDLAEYKLSEEGAAFAKYLSQRQGKTDLSTIEGFSPQPVLTHPPRIIALWPHFLPCSKPCLINPPSRCNCHNRRYAAITTALLRQF